mmetsp:Transcript_20252/g.40411  ORF Transcript_20252/g.40411 Transcript_20252/m.40411 type:complete len:562 (-) Transcript_20252:288-1973(-)
MQRRRPHATAATTAGPASRGSERGINNKRPRRRGRGAGVAVLFSASLLAGGVCTFLTIAGPGRSDADAGAVASGRAPPAPEAADRVNVFPPRYPAVTADANPARLPPGVLSMCAGALWHTLRTTTVVLPEDQTFVHTGDIDDLWLRDSAGQVHPLLLPWTGGGALVAQDERLARVVSGLIRRCAFYVRHDPYANAFRIDTSYVFNAEQRAMGRHDYISTWNYELDSGCYFLRMVYFYYKALPDAPVLRDPSVREAVEMLVDLWTAEQRHEDDVHPTGDLFDCQNCKGPYRYPSLSRGGKGAPTQFTGMTWTGFRPSDDECEFHYLVPANMFAVVALGYAAEMADTLWTESEGLAGRAARLAHEIDAGIQAHGVVDHDKYGRIYAYEVDGLGNSVLMDDANVPSLLSAPYLGYKYDEEVYENTRRFIFSRDNPTYQKGHNHITGEIEGYGSPHMTGAIQRNIWPMAMAVRGLTSDDREEKIRIINQLHKASAGTSWMHESFDVSRPKTFTRAWFCWADALFAELVLSVSGECLGAETYSVMEWRDPVLPEGGPFAGTQEQKL